jgi:hypothetical protein
MAARKGAKGSTGNSESPVPVGRKANGGKAPTRRPIDFGEQVVLDESALTAEQVAALQELLSRARVSREEVRIQAVFGANGGPLPSTWAFSIERGEVVVETWKATRRTAHGEQVGIVGFVVAAGRLPAPNFDDEGETERMASALADALIAEVR